ncbi:MAG: GC-type dockerin domain-anchored protein [Phycisphaerales bacterium]
MNIRNFMRASMGITIASLSASAALGSPPLELTGWTLFDPGMDWVYSNPTPTSGRIDEAVASSNVNAAWVVSDFSNGPTATITFTLQVAAGSGDDDLIGFVFAYENSDNFYLLDWKKATQTFNWGDPVLINDDTAEQGLKIKRIAGGWTLDGLWGGQDGIGVATIAGPTGGQWLAGTAYDFELALSPGHIVVTRNGSPLFDVLDAGFAGATGGIGFYGFSQDNIILSNVCVMPAPGGCPADINGDGTVDGGDLGLLLAAFGGGSVAADVNQDGTVDGSDLGIVLAAWGTDGC